MNPRVSLALCGSALAAAVLVGTHRPERLVLILAVETSVACVLAASRKLRTERLLRILAAGCVPALALAPLAALRPGHPLLQLPFGLTVSSEGLATSIGLLLASLGAALAAGLAAATMEGRDARRALASWRVPGTVVATLHLGLHQAVVLGDELERSRRAALARGAPVRGPLAFLAARGRLAALLGNALDRGERLDRALAARGFRGALPETPLPPLRRSETLGALGAALAAATAVVAP